jgi:hypothetical protein
LQQSTASAKKAPLLGPEAGVLSNKTDFEAILGADYVPKDGNGNGDGISKSIKHNFPKRQPNRVVVASLQRGPQQQRL